MDRQALNRALLARQLLLERAPIPALAAVEHLVGLQAQNPNPPYLGLWTRLAGFRTDDLAELLTSRAAVRIALLRGTVHLVSARDCLALRPVLQPLYDRDLATNTQYGPSLRGLDLAEVAAAGRALIEERPRTAKEIRDELGQRWPGREAALSHAVRGLLPCVQVPPRGLWGASGQPTLTTAQAWLGRPLARGTRPDRMVLRYLAAFGPATAADAQVWSGLPRLGEVVERLRPKLEVLRDERGRELFDLPDAPRPDPDTPAPVRFLPEYDNLLLSHADRTRVIAEEDRKRLVTPNGVAPPPFLVDGRVAGTWKVAKQRGAATLAITPFRRLAKVDAAALTREGGQLLDLLAPGAATRDIQLHPHTASSGN